MWSKIVNIARRELRTALTRPLYIAGLIFAPLVIMFLITEIYGTKIIRDIPSAVIDNDNSAASRRLIRIIDSHRYLAVKYRLSDPADAEKLMQNNKIFAVFNIPRDFGKDLKRSVSPVLSVSAYGANLLIGNIIYKAAAEIYTTETEELSLNNLTKDKGEAIFTRANFPSLKLDFHNLYNPVFSYETFLPPGAIPVILQMITVLLAATLFSDEREGKCFPQLLQQTDGSTVATVIGKGAPLLTVMTAYGFILYSFVFPVFGIPLKGNLITGVGLWVLLMTASYLLGITLSALFRKPLLSTEAAIFITAPAFAFSGYTFPLSELPALHRWFAYLMPSTSYITPHTRWFLQGDSAGAVFLSSAGLIMYTVIAAVAAFAVIKYRMHSCLKETNHA